MLSQRIAHVFHHLTGSIEVDDPNKTQLELLDLVNPMVRAHEAFISGAIDGKILPPNPLAVQKLYFEFSTNLDLRVKMYLTQATRLAKLPVQQFRLNDSLLSSFHPSEIAALLRDLDSVTGEYEEASNNSISFLIFLANLLLLGGIVVLILVALLIFRPMVSRINSRCLNSENYQSLWSRARPRL